MIELIDRKELLDELDEWERTETSNERALGVVDSKVIIAQMPTVDAVSVAWIPCSERMPEDEHAVLVYEQTYRNVFMAIYIEGRWESFDAHNARILMNDTIYSDIVAWMPCPKPYKAERKEEDAERDYELSVEMAEYCERYEPTYNNEDGSL